MKLPYKYVLVKGEILVHEETSRVIRCIFRYYLAGTSLGKIVDTLYAKVSLPHLVIRNEAERRWPNSYLMQSIFPLLVWLHIQKPSLNRSAGVMWTTVKLDILEKRADINFIL